MALFSKEPTAAAPDAKTPSDPVSLLWKRQLSTIRAAPAESMRRPPFEWLPKPSTRTWRSTVPACASSSMKTPFQALASATMRIGACGVPEATSVARSFPELPTDTWMRVLPAKRSSVPGSRLIVAPPRTTSPALR